MDIILMMIIILLYSFQTLFQTFYTKAYPGKAGLATPVFCILESVSIVVITLCFIGFRFSVRWQTLVIGLLNAAALFGYNTSLMKASAKGPYAFMNIMLNGGGILVPMIYLAFLGVVPTWYQYLGIAAMLVACVVINLEDFKFKGTSAVYYIMCGLLFLCNGLYSTFLKVQDHVQPDDSKEMIIITFALMGVIALIQLMVQEKAATANAFKMNRKSLFWLTLCLIVAALAINGMVTVIALMKNAAIFFTFVNGGVLLVSALYSIFLFKEKPTPLKIIGILLAVTSMVVLSLPQ